MAAIKENLLVTVHFLALEKCKYQPKDATTINGWFDDFTVILIPKHSQQKISFFKLFLLPHMHESKVKWQNLEKYHLRLSVTILG